MAQVITPGDRFGYLTVIAPDKRPKRTSSWLCRCDCGTEIYCCSTRLLHGTARSCGCQSHKNRNESTDLTGRRYGHLLVLSRSDNPRRKSSWLCQCDCGNTMELPASSLLAGRRNSCGCIHHSCKHPYADLTGRRFGHITVIARNADSRYKTLWRCVCDCGTEFYAYTSALLKGKHTSCGKCKYHLTKVKESMIGKRFHHLTVKGIVEPEPHKFMLLCLCDCGEYIITSTSQLTYGYTRSCGCDLKKKICALQKYVCHNSSAAQKLGTNCKIRYHSAKSNTGIRGIHKRSHLSLKPYEVTITCQRKYHFIGHFATLEEAIAARQKAEEEFFRPLIEQLDKNTLSSQS